jgi:hypothetical protein
MIRMSLCSYLLIIAVLFWPAACFTADKDRSILTPEEMAKRYRGSIGFDNIDWDFGYAPRMSVLTYTYRITNNGDDSLMIAKVKPGCACTSAPLKKDILAPGETTDLNVKFKTLRGKGLVRKDIKIKSSDPVSPDTVLHFISTIDRPHPFVEARPQIVNFVQVKEGKSRKLSILLTNNSDNDLDLEIVDPPDAEYLKADLKRDGLKARKTSEISVDLSGKAPPGHLEDAFTVEFRGCDTTRISFPIIAEIIARN